MHFAARTLKLQVRPLKKPYLSKFELKLLIDREFLTAYCSDNSQQHILT